MTYLKNQFSAFDKFILRTPLLPIDTIKELECQDKELFLNQLQAWFKNPIVQESLFIASPDLYEMYKKWINKKIKDEKKIKKIKLSLLSYLLRMSYRPTPFGLFAGCSVGYMGSETNILLQSRTQNQKHTRLDMNYLCSLAYSFEKNPAIKSYLKFSPNTTLFKIGNQYRFITYIQRSKNREYSISSVEYTSYLDHVITLTKDGKCLKEIARNLSNENISTEEATEYIEELISNQILVSSLTPNVTGSEFLNELLRLLDNFPKTHEDKSIKELGVILHKIKKAISKSAKTTGLNPQKYIDIANDLKKLRIQYKLNFLFQIDTIKPTKSCKIDSKIAKDILRGVEILNKLHIKQSTDVLGEFAKAFYEKYEDQSVPLLQVLDTEIGVGFANSQKTVICPLIDDIILSNNDKNITINLSEKEQFLYHKYLKAIANKDYIMTLTKKELDKFKSLHINNFPDTLSAITTILPGNKNEEYDYYIYIDWIQSSPAKLLGRFCHANDQIASFATEITKQESKLNPGVIYAEIAHLPEERMGNVILRPVLRPFEIPFLTKSNIPKDYQIPLNDLWVSVIQEEIILYSKKLNKRIIPKLSSMHNFAWNNTQPIYNFLCSLDQQSTANLKFDWGSIENNSSFLPRVVFENLIFKRARWLLKKQDYQHLLKLKDKELLEAFDRWRRSLSMPRYILQVDGDMELLIDIENIFCLQLLQDILNKRSVITLTEALQINDKSIINSSEGSFTNQIIFSFVKNQHRAIEKNSSYLIPKYIPQNFVQRNFIPGSEWLYYKIYCGEEMANRLLNEQILTLVNQLLKNGKIDQWFFIRFEDPHPHIRIRFHVTKLESILSVIFLIKKTFQSILEKNLIWKIQVDTYKRELERYGFETIILAEKIFFHDSIAIANLLNKLKNYKNQEKLIWLWGLRSIDILLNDFQYTIEKKHLLLKKLKENFGQEFEINRELKKQIDKKYRKERTIIKNVLFCNKILPAETENILLQRSLKNKLLVPKIIANIKKSEIVSDNLMGSFIHMLCNRLFKSKQRKHELVIYDFLFRFYQSELAIKQKTKTYEVELSQ